MHSRHSMLKSQMITAVWTIIPNIIQNIILITLRVIVYYGMQSRFAILRMRLAGYCHMRSISMW